MRVTFELDEYGRLACSLSSADSHAEIVASNTATAAADLLAAVDRTAREGCGECYWAESSGEYRWMLRRTGDKVRVAVLWMTGVLTGWEHVFWAECDFADLARQVRDQLSVYSTIPTSEEQRPASV